MSTTLRATQVLASPSEVTPQPVCVAFGDETFLKQRALAALRARILDDDEAEFSFTSFEGKSAALSDVLEELSTIAMFGGARRFVLVRQADDFVTRFRGPLESYVAKPRRTGVLALDVKSWPKNTRLYKAVAASGLMIDCTPPAARELPRWIVAWAEQSHQLKIDAGAAERLVEMIGPELGLIDQELAKLALVVPKGEKVSAKTIHTMVGSWRTRTAWEMLDAALAGRGPEALAQLDRLLLSGETPIGILAQVSFSLRRLAAATRLILAAEQAGRRISLAAALEQAGEKRFAIRKAEGQLRQLGRYRGKLLLPWLLQADLDLKGDSPMPPRQILERLLVKISAPALKTPDAVRRLSGPRRLS